MKFGLYPKLAWIGITKNKKNYIPYILTCIGMVMMYYIISFLVNSRLLSVISGGAQMQMILGFGVWVLAAFAVIFLFYTNSFLIKRRKKEFGLYNILGMGKWNIARILFWESLMIYIMAIIGGLTCGVLFSKLAELCMVKLLQGNASYILLIEPAAVMSTMILFAIIFALILINSMRQIHVAKPIELLHGDTTGEKPPRANWLLALAGLVMLGIAYYLALEVQDPMSALLWFFAAVILVILSTYVLFISGAVVLCRILQKNKRYYYKTNHFVSVSTMAYRMKRNGAGLASICILSTMVLVMVSSTSCLFFGMEGGLNDRYPRAIMTNTYESWNGQGETQIRQDQEEQIQQAIDESLADAGELPVRAIDYRVMEATITIDDGEISFEGPRYYESAPDMLSKVRELFIMPIEDYNELMGTDVTLQDNECLVYMDRSAYQLEQITLNGTDRYRVYQTKEFTSTGTNASLIVPSIFLFVSDYDAFTEKIHSGLTDGTNALKHHYTGFDLECDAQKQIDIRREIGTRINQLQAADESFPPVYIDSKADERSNFFALYGGLFFLGILLGMVFILATVLIMYYKQISEGYEDQSRFEIMQKVGMTKREIRKSINSQILVVFFVPLLAAGVHMAFAFPMLRQMLFAFNCTDTSLLMLTTLICFMVFALFYVLVYKLTSRAYYHIVSDKE